MVTALLILGYLIKLCFVVPMTDDVGDIIPHLMLVKTSAMVIYPSVGGYINYCYGFTYIDIPWFNTYFSTLLSDQS